MTGGKTLEPVNKQHSHNNCFIVYKVWGLIPNIAKWYKPAHTASVTYAKGSLAEPPLIPSLGRHRTGNNWKFRNLTHFAPHFANNGKTSSSLCSLPVFVQNTFHLAYLLLGPAATYAPENYLSVFTGQALVNLNMLGLIAEEQYLFEI